MKAKPDRPPRREAEAPVVLSLRIQPRSSRNGITLMEDGAFKIRLTAPPVDGAANEALIRYLSGVLSVSRSQVEIIAGHTARDKRIKITGVGQADVERLLNSSCK